MNVQYAKEVTELPAGSGGMAETLLMRLILCGCTLRRKGNLWKVPRALCVGGTTADGK
mgnify:CR=1 FL=1